MKPLRCPYCAVLLTGHTCLTERDAKPVPGDISACARCMRPFVFTVGGTREPSQEEVRYFRDTLDAMKDHRLLHQRN